MSWIEKLQAKPYATRLRILWGTVIVVGIVLIVAFVYNIKNTVTGIDAKDIIHVDQENSTPGSETNFVTIERVEQTEKVLMIYFNFNNTTNDILNISGLSDITLTSGTTQSHPTKLTDRQGDTFVQKVLSHTQNFGILTFPEVSNQKAVLK